MDVAGYPSGPYSEAFRKIDEYVSRNYEDRLLNLTTRTTSPTESSVGIELTVEAIKKFLLELDCQHLKLQKILMNGKITGFLV